MSTTRAQQIGIWVIAVVLTVGTIISFVAIIFANENQRTQSEQQQKDYAKQLEEYQKIQKEMALENAKNLEPLEGYAAAPFDAASVTELKVEVLRQGGGDVIKKTDTIKSSYFGWLSDGTIFDSSNKKDADDAPVSFPLSQVIKGWTEGLADQRVGSVVRLTIPADKAYGATESGMIPANSPLVFIVEIHSIEADA